MKLFYSTRGDGSGVSAPRAVLSGIAPDGGLYTLKEAPSIDLEALKDLSFIQTAKVILSAFLPGYTEEEIGACVDRAYAGKFDCEEIAPTVKAGDETILELFRGPTAAFKDVALSVLPQLMSLAMRKEGKDERILILTATSGDTGSAALTGFKDTEGIGIIVFFPDKGISPIQRAQMTAMSGSNVCACAINGNFDAAQTGVKQIFTGIPKEFLAANRLSLSSANSINFGRLAPQIVYYYTAYLRLVREGSLRMGDPLDFCVPTGNFGDILAGYYARLSGLPVGRLICASNENKVLTDFFETGVYDKRRPFKVTTSPSMDILVSSNLERLLYLASGCDAELIRTLMKALSEDGCYKMPDEPMSKIRGVFSAEYADDAEAAEAIKKVFEETGYLMDPHTAVARACEKKYRARSGSDTPCVVLATASPFKFPVSVLHALGKEPPADANEQIRMLEEISGLKMPETLRRALAAPVRFRDVIDPADMMEYVKKKASEGIV